jgi:hypothetical protein
MAVRCIQGIEQSLRVFLQTWSTKGVGDLECVGAWPNEGGVVCARSRFVVLVILVILVAEATIRNRNIAPTKSKRRLYAGCGPNMGRK